MLPTLLPPQKTKRGKTLLQRKRGSYVVVFFMFHKIPQQVPTKNQPHFGSGFVNTTIKISLLVEMNNLLNLLKQSGD